MAVRELHIELTSRIITNSFQICKGCSKGKPRYEKCTNCKKPAVQHPNLSHHRRVYALAEKYDIVSLHKLAAWKFRAQSDKWWSDYGFGDFAEVAREVYATTPPHDRGLKDVILDTIRDHRQLLDNKEVQDVLLGESKLAFDVAMELHKPGLRTSKLRDVSGQRKSNWPY